MKRMLGYCSPWSAAPGESVDVMVSVVGGGAFESQLVRVFCADPTPGGAGMDLRPVDHPSNGPHEGHEQRHSVGSCLWVEAREHLGGLSGLSLHLFVRPSAIGTRRQALISNRDVTARSGFTLELDERSCLRFTAGDGDTVSELSADRPLHDRIWWSVALQFDGKRGMAAIRQRPLGPGFELDGEHGTQARFDITAIAHSAAPLLIAARPCDDGTRHEACFNGKLGAVSLWRHAFAFDDIERFALDPLLEPNSASALLASWDAAPGELVDTMRDRGPLGLHAKLINLPSRAVKGPQWRGDTQSWLTDPAQYAAIEFHDDDVHDVGWTPSITMALPADLPSGFYAVRLTASDDESFIPFFVRPPRGAATAPVAFLAPTLTYIAYANYRFPLDVAFNEALIGSVATLRREDLHLHTTSALGLSTYDTHADGSGVRSASRRRPILNVGPGSILWNYGADTHLLNWFEKTAQAVDVVTDEDLHDEGLMLLSRYRVIVTGTHPEYWTVPMWDAMRQWLAEGGRLMYLGGNGFYWQAAMHPAYPGVIEVRRSEGGSRYWAEQPGEYHFAFGGAYAGMTRRTGRPPHALVGVGTRALGFEPGGWYERTAASTEPRAAFVFEGIARDERIGDFGVLGGAAGSEMDAADAALGTPRHALVLARSTGHGANTYAAVEDVLMLNPGVTAEFNAELHAEIVFFETPGGGAVFSVGSINWASSLAHDGFINNVARISGNVLRRFLDEEPFTPPRDPEIRHGR